MKLSVMAYSLILLFSYESIAGDDIYVDNMCGISSGKGRPCEWVKEVDFRIGVYNKKHKKMLSLSKNYVKKWISSREDFYKKDIRFTLNELTHIPSMKYVYDDSFNVDVLFNSFSGDDGLLITFILSSKKSFDVINRYCLDSSSEECVEKEINDFFNGNIGTRF